MDPLASLLAQLHRRSFLRGAGTAVAGAIVGCSSSADTGTDGGTDAGEDASDSGAARSIFDTYREIQEALRESPDHLPARAERLVAAGDPEAIFLFVRDQIRVYPTGVTQFRFDDFFTRQHFGPRATLRGGAGSPRDKVELLLRLYAEAGISAVLREGRAREEFRDLRLWLFSPIARSFSPAASAEQLSTWARALGIDPAAVDDRGIDIDRVASTALTSVIAPEVVDDLSSTDWDFRWLERLPIVELTIAGEVVHACPIIPTAEFGDSCVDSVEDLNPRRQGEAPEVRLRVEAATNAQPTQRRVLVEATWPAEDVAGRRVVASFVPTLDVADYLQANLNQIPAFIPSLSVEGATRVDDVPVFSGPAITESGTAIEIDDTDVRINGLSITGGTADASAVQALSTVRVDAGRFDSVTVSFTAVDGAGEPVEGLRAEAFRVDEEGQPVPFLLVANSARPRVAVLIDQSGSMPSEWTRPGMEAAFIDELTRRLQAAVPGAIVQHRSRADSALWANLAEATHGDPSVIVYVTDGDISDERTPEVEAALSDAHPAILVHVGSRRNRDTLQEMADLTGGRVVDADGYDMTVSAILTYVDAQTVPSYAIRYRAPVEGPRLREVRVSVPAASVTETISYEVPEVSGPPLRFAGLYLSVEIDGEEITRTLAGIPHDSSSRTERPADAEDEVASLFFSDIAIDFAAGRPTLAVELDETIERRLGVEALYEATSSGDSAAVLDALRRGVPRPHMDLAALPLPLDLSSDGSELHYHTGLRCTLAIEGPVFGTSDYRRTIDVLPFSSPSTATQAGDGRRAQATLQETARLAIGEATVHATSTLSVLEGQPLRYAGAGSIATFDDHPSLTDSEKEEWRRYLAQYNTHLKIVPESGRPFAFWAVEPMSGSVLGVLEGRGGAESYVTIEETYLRIIKIAEHLRRVGQGITAGNSALLFPTNLTLAPGVAPPFAVAAHTGTLLAQLFGVATLVIASLDGYVIPELLRRDIFATACRTLQRLLPHGVYGNIDNTLAALILGDVETECV
ncbi:MAG: hypothetical protein AAGE52_17220 [Myxococcota bacterium]